ncbi:MAG TPA: YbaB/EbfC family nucleoid-associated protein [Pilimelia sp.]|nr:YbaB/EbfC family nucleoid-associated protein [Pilimelia sp.]
MADTTDDDLVRSWVARAQEQAAQAAAVSARVRAARATAESPDGLVRVTVDADGALAALEFADGARKLALDDLAARTLAAARAARGRVAEAVTAVVAREYGADSPTAAFVSAAYAAGAEGGDGERPR